jgi:hypothetical protein
MVDTLTLDNVSSSAWEVTSTSGSNVSASTGVNNPDISLSNVGTRYEITNNGYSNHPLEFLDANDNVLLSQSGSGSYESDGSVNWVDNGSTVEFTLTQPLSNVLETYRCTIHTGNMSGTIISPTTVDYTPSSGSVSFTSPADNSTEENPVTFDMQATGFTIEAASNGVQDGAGHFHILVNQSPLNPGEVIPNDPANGYYHYGGGETTADITLPTGGSNTVVLQAGDANHRAYDLTDSITVTATTASSPSIDYTPNTGSISFTTPSDASTVENPVTFNMQATDFTIEPASNGAQDGAGHFHILVNQSALSAGQSIPNDPENGYYHYGDGETTASIALPTGSNTVVLQAGDADHNAYDLTDSITITVENPVTPIANLTQNVNTSSQETMLQAVVNNTTARQFVANKTTAISSVIDDAAQSAVQIFFDGIVSDSTSVDLLTNDDDLIDKISEDVTAIESFNASESAMIKLLARREGRAASDYASTDQIVNDNSLLTDITNRQSSSRILAYSSKYAASSVLNQTAVETIYDSTITVNEVVNSPTFMQQLATNSFAVTEALSRNNIITAFAGSTVAMNAIANNSPSLQEFANDNNALDIINVNAADADEVTFYDAMQNEYGQSSVTFGAGAGQTYTVSPNTNLLNIRLDAAGGQGARENSTGADGGDTLIVSNNQTRFVTKSTSSSGGGNGGGGANARGRYNARKTFADGGDGGDTLIVSGQPGQGGAFRRSGDGGDGASENAYWQANGNQITFDVGSGSNGGSGGGFLGGYGGGEDGQVIIIPIDPQ